VSTSLLHPRFLPLGIALVLSGSGIASAATLAVADPYNVLIFGNMTESSVDSERRIVAGGNLSYSGGEVH
jgi:hypothetical protein